MADSAPLPANPAVANSQQPPESDNKTSQSDPSPAPLSSSALPPPPPSIQSYSAVPPSFRPATPPAPLPGVGVGVTPMFSPLPNPNLQQQTSNFPNPSVQPPGVNSVPPAMIPALTAGAGAVQMASVPQIMPPYGVPGQMMRPYAPMPNGYHAMPQPVPQGAMLHPVS